MALAMTILTKSWLLCLICLILSIDAQRDSYCGPATDVIHYEWEKLDYYAILGLHSAKSKNSRRKRRAERQAFEGKDVRKAYRRQAQLYHPDKRNATISKEESNVRFARIAEAYEVLNDPVKRSDYDIWLLDCEDYLNQATSDGNRAHQGADSWSFLDNLRTSDPRRVFQEFFFGPLENKDATFDKTSHSKHRPLRVSERRKVMYDSNGNEIIRVLQTEEYPVEGDGTYFFRVVAQDYAGQYDRFKGWGYQPISQPFVVEEGYKRESTAHNQKSESTKNTLYLGEMMTQQSPVLSSKNSRFYAGVTPDCELVIMSDSSQHGVDDELIWSSKTFVPHLGSKGGCVLSLRGPILVLSVGDPTRPGAIIWHSDVPESIIIEEASLKESREPAPVYFARLDDDGSLAVYCLVNSTTKEEANVKSRYKSETWLSKMMSKAESSSRIKVVKALQALQKWKQTVLRTLNRNEPSHESSPGESSISEELCVYATGIAGCHAGGRKLFKLVHIAKRSIKSTISKIDSALDSMCEAFEGDDDDDFLDTVVRLVGKTGHGLVNTCQMMAQKGIKAALNVIVKSKAKIQR